MSQLIEAWLLTPLLQNKNNYILLFLQQSFILECTAIKDHLKLFFSFLLCGSPAYDKSSLSIGSAFLLFSLWSIYRVLPSKTY